MTKERKMQYLVGVIMLLIGAAIVYFAVGAMTNRSGARSIFSKDKLSEAYQTLTYEEAIEKLQQPNQKQAFYIGCRYCGHCLELEGTIKAFLAEHQTKNQNRDLIYKIEAGYNCVPKTEQDDYAAYLKIFDFLVKNQVAKDNEDKAFGTPQFILVENARVIDKLDNYSRSAAGLSQLFQTHKYRGF